MNWLGRTFVRALVWQGVREAGYEARRARHRPQGRYQAVPFPTRQVTNREVRVSFVCPKGHRWLQSFYDEKSPTERELSSSRCPDCGGYGHWLTLDYHRENDA